MARTPDLQRREQLLDELEAIVLSEGFAHLRVGAMAQRLRCSRSTLYKLAHSRDDLVRVIFARFAERMFADMDARADALDDPAEQILCVAAVIAEWVAKGSDRFWADASSHDITRPVLDLGSARGYQAVQRYIDRGIEMGMFRPANTGFLGYLVWLNARAARDPEVLGMFGLDPSSAFLELGQFIINGVRKPCE